MSANLVKPEKIIDIFMILDNFLVPMISSFNMSFHFIIHIQLELSIERKISKPIIITKTSMWLVLFVPIWF